MQAVISVDIGTTAAKISLVDLAGHILASKVNAYKLYSVDDCVEQEPEDWWTSFQKGVSELTAEHGNIQPAAIVLSGQMQDLIPIRNGRLTGKAILYSDTRARTEWVHIKEQLSEEKLIRKTRNLGDASLLSSKILWLRKNDSGKIDKDTVILLAAHDYIHWKLTNRFVTDHTNAAATGLMNFDENRWDPEILDFLKLTECNLPEIFPSDEIAGYVTAEAGKRIGLPAGLPVIHGAGDAGASTIGAGAGVEGRISCYLGTSGWIASTGRQPVDPQSGVFNLRHPDPHKVINVGPMIMTGGNVEWVLKAFLTQGNRTLPADSFDQFTREAENAAPGSSGVFYLPYLMGERSPFRDPDARGAFIGMRKDTSRSELFRAVLEGVSYSLKSILDIMSPEQQANRQIYLSGGGARDPLWAGILASMTGCKVLVASNARETGVLGNAILAGRALGLFSSYELPGGYVQIEKEYVPEKGAMEIYQAGYEIFKDLYPALKNVYGRIPALIHSAKNT